MLSLEGNVNLASTHLIYPSQTPLIVHTSLYSLKLFKSRNLHGYGRILRPQESILWKVHGSMFFIVTVRILLHARSEGILRSEIPFIPETDKSL